MIELVATVSPASGCDGDAVVLCVSPRDRALDLYLSNLGSLSEMAVRLHRCSLLWLKFEGHPCWRVQKALDEAQVPYELVKGPLQRGKRDEIERLSGQHKYPVIEFQDGSAYREDSKEMAAAIRGGRLHEKRADSP